MADKFESWFVGRRRVKAIEMILTQTKVAINCVDELKKCFEYASRSNKDDAEATFKRVQDKEHEGDVIRKSIIDELAKSNLRTYEKTSLMRLARQIDWIADWALESANVLTQFNISQFPEEMLQITSQMSSAVKDCSVNVEDCIEKLTAKHVQASLEAADQVERFEEEADNLHRKARGLITSINDHKLGIGSIILFVHFLESLENVSDKCEDTCDQARVIAVLHSKT